MNDAEFYVVGAVLQYPEAMKMAIELEPVHFTDPALADVWWAILKRFQAGEVWGPVIINQATEGKHQRLIAALVSESSVYDVRGGVESIMDRHHTRNLEAAAHAQLQAIEEGKSSTEVAKIARDALDHASKHSGLRFKTGHELCLEILDDLKSDVKPRSTGIPLLDEAMGGGMFPGEMYGLGGRKKTGKTMFAGTLSYNLSKQGAKHLYIASEMGSKKIHQRILARHLNMFPSAYKSGYAEQPRVMTEIAYASSRMPDSCLFLDAPGITMDGIKQAVAVAVLKHGIEGFIMDYWQLIGGQGKMGKTEHQDYTAQELANVAAHFNIWNWTLSQINQDGNTRGGEGIRNACTMMFEAHRPDKTRPEVWFEMMETRNTDWCNIGSEEQPALMIDAKGPYFRQLTDGDRFAQYE